MIRALLFTSIAAGLAVLSLISPASAQSTPSAPGVEWVHLGADTTQHVALKPGPNFVSLFVQPTETNLDKLFGGGLTGIISIRNADGLVYSPSYNVRTLTEWGNGQAYVVHVRQQMAIEVTGQRIEPDTGLLLDKGWNDVAFLYDQPVHVDSALISIAESLDRIEDGEGRMYPAMEGREPLTQLEPGAGYRIHVSGRDTLVYADGLGGTSATSPPATPTTPPSTPQPPSTGRDTTVSTIADALALRGLVDGQTIEVLGYYAPGDGGGGVFDVRDSGQGPNGGTVFVTLEHQSDERVSATTEFAKTVNVSGVPRNEDVVFGSVTLDLLDSRDNLILSVPGEHLHGHTYGGSTDLGPLFYYEGGVFHDNAGRVAKAFNGISGGWREGRVRFSYRHTTSSLRLHRRDVGDEIDVTWFGARTQSESPDFDNQPVICQALNVAQALNEAGGAVESVILPKTEVYGYYGTIEVPDGMTIRGGGGTYLATATDDLGNTYRPVRIRDEHTALRVLDDEALTFLRMLKDPSDADYLPPDVKQALEMRQTRITISNNIMYAGLKDIVLDGNWEGNMQAWDEGWGTHSEFEAYLRNQPGWSGFTASAGKDIPIGQELVIRNAAILGYAATGILGHANNTWNVENLLLGNALYNHVLYGANGVYNNLTFIGFAWSHTAWLWGEISNFVYERGSPSPTGRSQGQIFQIRGGDEYDPNDVAGHTAYTRSDGTLPPLYTTINGFYVDLRGSESGIPFDGLGSNISIAGASESDPGIVIVPGDRNSIGLFNEDGNGYQKSLYNNNHFGNAIIYDMNLNGTKMSTITKTLNATNSSVFNVEVRRMGGEGGRSFHLAARRRNHPSWDLPQVQLFENIVNGPTHFIADVTVEQDDPVGMDVFVRNSAFDNSSARLFNGSGGGQLKDLEGGGDPAKLRVFMEDVMFNMATEKFSGTELFFAMARFRQCTDRRSDRTSETERTIRASDFNGLEAIVPLNLFWAPLERSFVQLGGAGAAAVASWEVTDANGRALGEDKREPHIRIRLSEALGSRTLTVDAAVRPWESGIVVPDLLP